MSKYTTEVRFICETFAGLTESVGYNQTNDIIARSRELIFDFEYPIFDESYRAVLETKILKHFYTREIGAETAGLWHLWLDRKMNEIMPYYNKLYESELINFNPMYDTDYERSGNRDGERSGERHNISQDSGADTTQSRNTTASVGNVTSQDSGSDSVNIKDTPKNNRWDYFSDTPQGSVGDLASLDYLTNARHIVDDGAGSNRDDVTTYGKKNTTNQRVDGEGTGNSTLTYGKRNANDGSETMNTTEEYAEHVIGKMSGVSFSKMLQEFRETFLNIDMMIIRELEDLFFTLW